MTYPQYSWSLEPTISFSCGGGGSGAAGNPALVMDSQQNTYFASIQLGQNPTASPNVASSYQLYYNLAVGSADQAGNLLWYKVFPELVMFVEEKFNADIVEFTFIFPFTRRSPLTSNKYCTGVVGMVFIPTFPI